MDCVPKRKGADFLLYFLRTLLQRCWMGKAPLVLPVYSKRDWVGSGGCMETIMVGAGLPVDRRRGSSVDGFSLGPPPLLGRLS